MRQQGGLTSLKRSTGLEGVIVVDWEHVGRCVRLAIHKKMSVCSIQIVLNTTKPRDKLVKLDFGSLHVFWAFLAFVGCKVVDEGTKGIATSSRRCRYSTW
jgi:hypothetical protein